MVWAIGFCARAMPLRIPGPAPVLYQSKGWAGRGIALVADCDVVIHQCTTAPSMRTSRSTSPPPIQLQRAYLRPAVWSRELRSTLPRRISFAGDLERALPLSCRLFSATSSSDRRLSFPLRPHQATALARRHQLYLLAAFFSVTQHHRTRFNTHARD